MSSLFQQTETVDIGTCDQAVPKAYTDKGNIEFIDISFHLSVICSVFNWT